MKTKDELIEWLRDAYAIERAMEVALRKQVDTRDLPLLMREQAARHLTETQHHAEAVAECLQKLGSETSTLKTAMAKGLEIMKGASTAFAGDHRVKDLLGMCAAEHFEIACYTALRAGAARFGFFDIVEVCNDILKEEHRMAEWLEGNLPHLVMGYLEEAESIKGSSEAEDDDMPEAQTSAVLVEQMTATFDFTTHRVSHEEAFGRPPEARVRDEHAEFLSASHDMNERQGKSAAESPALSH